MFYLKIDELKNECYQWVKKKKKPKTNMLTIDQKMK